MKRINTTPGGAHITSEVQTTSGQIDREVFNPKLLRVACGFVLAGMLVAGLWPFHSPRNRVTWFAGGNGLHFGRHGVVLSSGKLNASIMPEDAPCSLEIWFVPDLTEGGGALFALYSLDKLRQFSLRQSIADLLLASELRKGRYRTQTTKLYFGDIFRRGKPLFVTVTAKRGRMSVYIDGTLAGSTPKFPLSGQDFNGKLVIGTLPRTDDSWSGLLRGLAFYDQELSPARVSHHYDTWVEKGRPDISEDEHAVALYLFDEHAGHVIHNQVPSRTDLYIPDRYQVLDQIFLQPFWQEFRPNRGYWKDVLINIAGFVPFGFLVCAYFSLSRRIKTPAMIAILLGFIVSFTIESLQAFLPTRDSGTTDLITNTLGTGIGVWLYRLSFWRVLVARIRTQLPSSKIG